MAITTISFDDNTYVAYNICSSTLATALLTTGLWIQKELDAGTLNDENSLMEYESDLEHINIPIEYIIEPFNITRATDFSVALLYIYYASSFCKNYPNLLRTKLIHVS